MLTAQGKTLQTGQEVRFTLVKGPNFSMLADPVNPKAPKEQFPLIAKFGESVVKPELQQGPWSSGRLYQQDIPKAQEDSDEEDTSSSKPLAKRRWRARKEVPKRQWVLQEQVEFLEAMMAKRQHKDLPKDSLSTRYEGIPEHNASQYCLLESSVDPSSMQIQVTVLPKTNPTISFSQPKNRKTLSMTEAEHAIEDQRGKMSRFMMHDKQQLLHGTKAPTNESRKRLFGKLAAKKKAALAADDEAEDDIMGDLAFRNRKGNTRARKELLNTLGDSSLKVDADGVLGGNNDSVFGRGQRFGRFKAEQAETANNTSSGDADTAAAGKSSEPSSRGNDGLAMADDFYQRDVQAEYEELDYDANEQFDDDDVDVGETEVVVEGSGYADDEDDDELEEDELNGERPSGAEGLASVAGFRLLLAKARGEITPEQAAEAAEGAKLKEKQREEMELVYESKKRKRNEGDDHLTKIMAAAEKSRQEAEKRKREAEENAQEAEQAPKKTKLDAESTDVQVDESGNRILTLLAVQKEIWLRHSKISMKRLMKIFGISKKSAPERRTKFREVIKELCTMEMDPVEGSLLVLKQHYRNMTK